MFIYAANRMFNPWKNNSAYEKDMIFNKTSLKTWQKNGVPIVASSLLYRNGTYMFELVTNDK